MIQSSLGNLELLKLPKTAFLCSRKIPAAAVLPCYDWAIAQRELGNCVISGFHSPLEKEVLHFLLKGTQPIIVALARGLKIALEKEFVEPLAAGNLLIISPFNAEVKRVNSQTAEIRNKMMIHLADSVVVGFVSKGGSLDKLLISANKEYRNCLGHLPLGE